MTILPAPAKSNGLASLQPFFIRLRQDTLSRFGGTAGRNGEATAL